MAEQLQVRGGVVHAPDVPLEALRVVAAQHAPREAAHEAAAREAARRRLAPRALRLRRWQAGASLCTVGGGAGPGALPSGVGPVRVGGAGLLVPSLFLTF